MTAERLQIHTPQGISERISDAITSFAGSWLCVDIHAVWFVLWLKCGLDINLLTMVVSLEAIFLISLVMISQNRAARRDRLRDDAEASEVLVLRDEMRLLKKINERQLEMLLEGREHNAQQTQIFQLFKDRAA